MGKCKSAFRASLNHKTEYDPEQRRDLHDFLDDVFRSREENELIVLNGKSKRAVAGEPLTFPLPQEPDPEAYWAYNGNEGRQLAYPVSKITPKRASTPDLTDVVINLRDKCGALYADSASHFYDKKHQSYCGNNIRSCFTVYADVDNFPLELFPDNETKAAAVFARYPFLEKLRPNYITDTGKKGFQIFYCFHEDIVSYQLDLPRFLSAVITSFVGGDPACVRNAGSFRMPLSTRSDGRDCGIIYKNRKLRHYGKFCKTIAGIADGYSVAYDGGIYENEEAQSIWKSGDIISTLGEYCVERYGLPKWVLDAARNPVERKVYRERKKQQQAQQKKSEPELKINKCSHAYKRVKDLGTVFKFHEGHMTGMRNDFLYDLGVATYWTACAGGKRKDTAAVITDTLKEWNGRFTEPLGDPEVKCIINSILRKACFRSDAKLNVKYNMSETPGMLNRYLPSQKQAHHRAMRNRLYEPIKKANRLKRAEADNRFVEIAAVTYSPTEIAKLFGCSRQTVYNMLSRLAARVSKARNKVIRDNDKKPAVDKKESGKKHAKAKTAARAAAAGVKSSSPPPNALAATA